MWPYQHWIQRTVYPLGLGLLVILPTAFGQESSSSSGSIFDSVLIQTATDSVSPKVAADPAERTLETLLTEANEAERRQDWKSAFLHYDEAMKRAQAEQQRPSEVMAIHRMAVIRAIEKKYDDSEELFRQALILGGDNVVLLGDFAKLFSDQQRYDDAETVLKNAMLVEPNHRRTLFNLGLVIALQENREMEGLRYLKIALGDAGAYRELAKIYRWRQNVNQAEFSEQRASLAEKKRTDQEREALKSSHVVMDEATKTELQKQIRQQLLRQELSEIVQERDRLEKTRLEESPQTATGGVSESVATLSEESEASEPNVSPVMSILPFMPSSALFSFDIIEDESEQPAPEEVGTTATAPPTLPEPVVDEPIPAAIDPFLTALQPIESTAETLPEISARDVAQDVPVAVDPFLAALVPPQVIPEELAKPAPIAEPTVPVTQVDPVKQPGPTVEKTPMVTSTAPIPQPVLVPLPTVVSKARLVPLPSAASKSASIPRPTPVSKLVSVASIRETPPVEAVTTPSNTPPTLAAVSIFDVASESVPADQTVAFEQTIPVRTIEPRIESTPVEMTRIAAEPHAIFNSDQVVPVVSSEGKHLTTHATETKPDRHAAGKMPSLPEKTDAGNVKRPTFQPLEAFQTPLPPASEPATGLDVNPLRDENLNEFPMVNSGDAAQPSRQSAAQLSSPPAVSEIPPMARLQETESSAVVAFQYMPVAQESDSVQKFHRRRDNGQEPTTEVPIESSHSVVPPRPVLQNETVQTETRQTKRDEPVVKADEGRIIEGRRLLSVTPVAPVEELATGQIPASQIPIVGREDERGFFPLGNGEEQHRPVGKSTETAQPQITFVTENTGQGKLPEDQESTARIAIGLQPLRRDDIPELIQRENDGKRPTVQGETTSPTEARVALAAPSSDAKPIRVANQAVTSPATPEQQEDDRRLVLVLEEPTQPELPTTMSAVTPAPTTGHQTAFIPVEAPPQKSVLENRLRDEPIQTMENPVIERTNPPSELAGSSTPTQGADFGWESDLMNQLRQNAQRRSASPARSAMEREKKETPIIAQRDSVVRPPASHPLTAVGSGQSGNQRLDVEKQIAESTKNAGISDQIKPVDSIDMQAVFAEEKPATVEQQDEEAGFARSGQFVPK